jgi:hypothetical protein
MDLEKAINNIENQAKEDTEFSRELRTKFFFHWAILSGVAITLFIPFLSSEVVKNNVDSSSELYVNATFIFLIISLLFSSLRNFLLAREILKLGQSKYSIVKRLKEISSKPLTQEEELKTSEPWKVTEIVGWIAIVSFVLGIISAYIFISKIIF